LEILHEARSHAKIGKEGIGDRENRAI